MLLGDGSRQRRGQAEDGKEREAAGRAHVRRLLATERPGLTGPETTTPDRQAVGRPKGFGGAEEDRTPDLRIANATLSQLSYRPHASRQVRSEEHTSE